jgi:hypothetical protein
MQQCVTMYEVFRGDAKCYARQRAKRIGYRAGYTAEETRQTFQQGRMRCILIRLTSMVSFINYGKEIREANAEPNRRRRAQALWCSPRLAMQKVLNAMIVPCRAYARMLYKLGKKSPQGKMKNKVCA